SHDQWGMILARYALFQRLRRRESETDTDHLARQDEWLSDGLVWQRHKPWRTEDIRVEWPPDPIDGTWNALGTWIASPDQIAGAALDHIVSISPTGRVLVFDIASDKEMLMAAFSDLVDREREAAGIAPVSRRGRRSTAERKIKAMRRIWPGLMDSVRREA